MPSYVLLLFLFRYKAELNLNENIIIKIIRLLVSFFVRRNITDVPPTRDVTRMFMSIIAEIDEQGITGDEIWKLTQSTLSASSAPASVFEEKHKGDIYEDILHDQAITKLFSDCGWIVVRIWECELKKRNRNSLEDSLRRLFD